MIGKITLYPNGFWGAGYGLNEPTCSGQNYLSSGGAADGYLYDIVDAKRGTVVTIDTAGETTSAVLDMDLDTTLTNANFTILDNHNLKTADAIPQFQVDAANNNVTSPVCYAGALEAALTQMAEYVGKEPAFEITLDGVCLCTFTADTAANWAITIAFGDTSFDADITIGEWFVGKSFAPATSPEQPELISNFDGILLSRTSGGQNLSSKRYGERQAWKLKWPYISESDRDEFLRVWQDTEGPRYPFYIDLGEAATPQLYFVRFVENSLNIRKLTSAAYELSFTIESEV